MVRFGFPFNHTQLSFAQWLAAQSGLRPVQQAPAVLPPGRRYPFDRPSKMGDFTPKILSTIQPITILEGQRWENYRPVDSGEASHYVSGQSGFGERGTGDSDESSSSSSLGLEDFDMFVSRNNQLHLSGDHSQYQLSSSSGNTLSSISSLLSEDGLDVGDFIASGFVYRNAASVRGMSILDRLHGLPRVPVMPPPYPYPEEPPPTYEEAMFSNNPNIDAQAAEEVAITLAELDSVLSEYHTDAPSWGADALCRVHSLPNISSAQEEQDRAHDIQSDNIVINLDDVDLSPTHQQSEDSSNENAQNFRLVSQGVQTDSNLSQTAHYSDAPAHVSQSSHQSPQTCDVYRNCSDLTCDLRSGTQPAFMCVDPLIRSALNMYSLEPSPSVEDEFPMSYELSSSRDVLY